MSDGDAAKHLKVYLQDHSAGAVGALELLDHLSDAYRSDPLGAFFTELRSDIEADHNQLHNLMSALGLEESSLRNAGAWMAEKIGRIKLGITSEEDAKLRLLQALETLLIGITGKKMLWRALAAVRESSPVLQRTDFAQMESRAAEQARRVEEQRLLAAQAAFRGS
ncbi:MAG TPA: hypothetical protein VGK72_01545 [Chthoniobacterales bacterium]